MAKVEIRLEDTNLLKWFNQIHAALLTADKSIWGGHSSLSEDAIRKRQKIANTSLIATLQSVIKEIQQDSAK